MNTNSEKIMDKSIKVVVEIVNSKADTYGNRYYYARFTRTSNSKVCEGIISGDASNVTYTMRLMYANVYAVKYVIYEISYRDYKNVTKHFDYIGCTPEEIIKSINTQWGIE